MVAQHTIEVLEGAKARVTFCVAGESTASEYQKVVNKCAKSIELKGFRKGKVPLNLLERKFAKEFRAEAFNEILEQCTKDSLPSLEPKPLPYSKPCLCDQAGTELAEDASLALLASFQPGQQLEFAVGFETAPAVPLATLDTLQFEAFKIVPSTQDVDDEIARLREQNAVMVARKSGHGSDGDILSLRFAILAEGQTEPPEAAKMRAILRLGEADAHGFHDQVKGLETGEVILLKSYNFPDEESVEEELRGKHGDVWVEVSGIRTRELPELDDDFAQDIDENYKTLEDLQKATREKLAHDAEHLLENYSLLQIYRHWAANLEFAIPQAMAAYQTQRALENIKQRVGGKEQNLMMYLGMQHDGDVQKGLLALEKETLLGLFVDLVRAELLQSKNWQADDEDIERELEHLARHQGTTAAELKDSYKEQWQQVKESLGQAALSTRLSKELVAAAGAQFSAPAEILLPELRQKSHELEKICHDLVYEKFSPFKGEGGLLNLGS